jgi:cyclopropane-fatty-acyl-phospholipid synthase
MAIKFKSQATGDLVMVQATAEAVLALLGKSPNQPGIIEPADMAQALVTLKGASDEVPKPNVDDDDERELGFSDEVVSLRKHAYPLVLMIERALAAGKPIVWGA